MGLSEFDLIRQYFSQIGDSPSVRVAVGDDAAVLQLPEDHVQLISVDTAVSGVHFLPTMSADVIAYRAIMTAASDLAAMGAKPEGMLLALTLPEAGGEWLAAFAEGARKASLVTAMPLIGGDTTRGPLCVTVTVLGSAPANGYLTRDGARPGDRLCVSGTLGDAAAGLSLIENTDASLSAEQAMFLQQRFTQPTARLALGQTLSALATSAIDVSDGLLADAGHLARASDVRLVIQRDAIPFSVALQAHPDQNQVQEWVLRGGDDYELLFTLPPEAALPDDCTEIGLVVAGQGVQCEGAGPMTGYDHFGH